MPCDTYIQAEQTAEERQREIDETLEELQRAMANGAVEVRIGTDGGVCFANWGEERRGITDVCAFQRLSGADSWELRQAVARAETLSGNKVSKQAVAAGVHSHDGGSSWGTD